MFKVIGAARATGTLLLCLTDGSVGLHHACMTHPYHSEQWRTAISRGLCFMVVMTGCGSEGSTGSTSAKSAPIAIQEHALTAAHVFRSVTVLAAPEVPVAPDATSAAWRPFDPAPYPPTCDEDDSGVLTRSACPPPTPEGDCGSEGLECRYAQGDSCAQFHECVYGIWTYIGEECLGETEEPSVLAGTAACPVLAPIPDSPCAEDGQACGYQPCPIGEWPSVEYTCTCGRWALTYRECPRD